MARAFAPGEDGEDDEVDERVDCKVVASREIMDDIGSVACLPAARAAGAGETLVDVIAGLRDALHFDHCHCVIAQVVGHKRLLIFPSTQHARVCLFSALDGNVRTSRVDIGAWQRGQAAELYKWPQLSSSFCLESLPSPGDVAYIPAGFWHHVTSLSPSVSFLMPF